MKSAIRTLLKEQCTMGRILSIGERMIGEHSFSFEVRGVDRDQYKMNCFHDSSDYHEDG